MATYRVIDHKGDVVETKDIESADDAHARFADSASTRTRPSPSCGRT